MEASTVQTPAPRYRVVSLDRKAEAAPAKPAFTVGQVMRALAGCAGAQGKEIKATLSGGSVATGGATLPDDMFDELVVNVSHRMECVQAGARVLQLMHGDLKIAKISGMSYPEWRSESDPFAEDDPAFSGDVLTPRSGGLLVKVPRELLDDGFEIEQRLEEFLYTVMARHIDFGVLTGSGTPPEPEGLLTLAALTAPDTEELFSYRPILNCYWSARSYILGEVPRAVMISAGAMPVLDNLDTLQGSPAGMPKRLAELTWVPSKVLQTSATPPGVWTAVVGDFSQLLIGWRGAVRIEVLRERFADEHQVAFVVHARVGAALLNKWAFYVHRKLVPMTG